MKNKVTAFQEKKFWFVTAFYLQVLVSTETPSNGRALNCFSVSLQHAAYACFHERSLQSKRHMEEQHVFCLATKTLEQFLAALSANGSGTPCFYFPVCKERKDPFSSGQILKGEDKPWEGILLKKLLGQSNWNRNEIIWKNLKVNRMRPLTVLYPHPSFQGYRKLTFHSKCWT